MTGCTEINKSVRKLFGGIFVPIHLSFTNSCVPKVRLQKKTLPKTEYVVFGTWILQYQSLNHFDIYVEEEIPHEDNLSTG